MLLAIDVGNTNIVLGVFEGERLVATWRLLTLRERTADEVGLMVTGLCAYEHIALESIEAVVMASVVPVLTPIMRGMVARFFKRDVLVVDPLVNAGMPILYERPAEVGADRIANAVAGFERHGKASKRPLIIADLGTTTTFDAVTAAGEYLGGAICPGPQIAADALFQRAARLPRVEVRKPASAIGHTTVGAIESGLFFGYLGTIEGLMTRIDRELGGGAIGIATGGLAPLVVPETTVFAHHEPDITLQGLRLIWDSKPPLVAALALVTVEIAEYCREIEAYLCRKNDGHLIRIVGPSFELVSGWAERGVPIKVAFQGIDRYVERYYAKGPRRRPVRIDFCDADVLDGFDAWRRATGVATTIAPEPSREADSSVRRGPSLPAHLERVLRRLTTARVNGTLDQASDDLLDSVSRELETAKAGAKTLRGETRQALVDRLAALDRELLDIALARFDEDARRALLREAEDELAGFRTSMPTEAFERARASIVERLVRDRASLPTIAFT